MTELTLLTREGCHLCERMKSVLTRVQALHAVTVREVDIAGSPDLETRYGLDIPVLLCQDRVIARHRTSVTQVLEQLTAGPR